MRRPLGVLCVFVIACTSSAPSEQAAKADAGKQAEVDAKQAEVDAKKADLDAIDKAEAARIAEVEAKEAEALAKQAEAAKLDALVAVGEKPVFVMLGGSGSRTNKPVRNAVLAKSWGWGSRSAAEVEACEASTSSPGQLMACGSEDKPKDAAALLAKLAIAGGKSVFVTPEQIASWNVPAPIGPVWLVGPKQACKAAVGRPLVGWYSIDEGVDEGDEEGEGDEGAKPAGPDLSDDFTVLELAWELTGCDDANDKWAPIGVAAAELDPTTRWVTVKAGERERFDPATWTGPLASEVAKLPEAAKSREDDEDAEPVTGDPEWWTQTFELPGTEVRELYFGAAWRGPDGSKAPAEYDCGDSEFGEVFQVRQTADVVTTLGRGSRGKLVGALVAGVSVHTMVWTDSLDYQVAKLEPTGLGETIDLSSGVYYPEDGGETDYSLIGYCGP